MNPGLKIPSFFFLFILGGFINFAASQEIVLTNYQVLHDRLPGSRRGSDGILNPGEELTLLPILQHVPIAPVIITATASLHTLQPDWVQIIKGEIDLGYLLPYQEVTPKDGFKLVIKDNVPWQSRIFLQIRFASFLFNYRRN